MTSTLTVQQIPINDLYASPMNPRRRYDEASLDELAQSIRNVGILQPLVARPRPNGYFELAAGHRRWMAARKAGLETVPVTVRDLGDVELRLVLLTENGQRADVHPLDESDALQALLDAGLSVGQLSDHLGRPVQWIRRRLLLQACAPATRQAYLAGEIELGHAQLAATRTAEEQEAACTGDDYRLWQEPLFDDDGEEQATEPRRATSVRAWADYFQSGAQKLSKAKWDLTDATLFKAAGACSACPKRTGAQAELLPELAGDDKCTDEACWGRKLAAHVDRQLVQLKKAHPKVLEILAPTVDNRDQIKARKGEVIGSFGPVGSWGQDGWYPSKEGAPGAVPALVRDGHEAGRVQWVTRTKPPEKKPASSAAKQDPAAARKEKARTAAIEAARKAITAKIPMDVTKGPVGLAIVREALDDMGSVPARDLAKAKDVNGLLQLYIRDWIDGLGSNFYGRGFTPGEEERLFDAAKLVKADLAPIVKQYQAAIAKPAKVAAAPKATSKAPAKKPAKKGKAVA